MASPDYSISGLTQLTAPAAADMMLIVDASDTLTTPAGINGSDKYVTVSTLSSAITSTKNAVTQYGADPTGGTDSSSVIQAALNTGMNVYLPTGTYKASGLSLTADGQWLRGDGPSQTIIKPASGTTADVLLSGPLPASAGLSGYIRNYGGFRDLRIDGVNMTGTTAGQGNGIHGYGWRFGRIINCYFTNIPNWAMLMDGDNTGPGNNFGYNVHVYDCIIDTGCNGGFAAVNCEACNITQNEFKSAGAALAAAQPLFTSPNTSAYQLRMTNGYAYIAGNVFGNLGAYTTEAVRMENSGPCRIIGNRFDQVRYQAIHCTAGQNIIAGNQIGNPSSVGTVEGILLGSAGNIVEGNTFDVTNGAAHYTYCISEAAAYAGNIIRNNQFNAGTSGVLNLNSGSTPRVAGNAGYNPVGKISPGPQPVTSGVAVTNTTGADCAVFVTCGAGVSVSAISVGGQAYPAPSTVSASTTSTSIRVPAGQAITLTFTGGTPSLTWFGD